MAEIVHQEGDYKIETVGPKSEFSFKGNDGNDVFLSSYSVQFENITDWVSINLKQGSDAPKAGDVMKGHIEDNGKYGMKFVKARTGGGWSGGGKSNPGAAWNAAYGTATAIVTGYFQIATKKPKTMEEFIGIIDALAPQVKAKVDALAGKAEPEAKPAESKQDDGIDQTPPEDGAVVQVDDIPSDALGKW